MLLRIGRPAAGRPRGAARTSHGPRAASVALAIGALLTGAGCTSPADADPCADAPFWGEPAGTPELQLGVSALQDVVFDPTAPISSNMVHPAGDGGPGALFVALSDGDEVRLVTPPQGGRVIFAAARIRNMSGCRARIKGVLRDPESGRIAAEERRTVDFAFAAGDGWGEADVNEPANAANVPACPNYTVRDLPGKEWQLEVTVTDRTGERSASATRRVTPACRQADARERATCVCECTANYTFERCGAGFDGGVPEAPSAPDGSTAGP